MKVAKLDVYRGNALIVLDIDPDNPIRQFSFGLTKAKAILRELDAIKKFVESDGKEV